jgi:hypothetical protein
MWYYFQQLNFLSYHFLSYIVLLRHWNFIFIQVKELRQRFHHSIAPGGLAGDRRGVVPVSGFSFSSQQIWKVIRENKDLDLPAHKVYISTPLVEDNEVLVVL